MNNTNDFDAVELELAQKVEALYLRRERSDVGTPDYEDINFDLELANYALGKLRRDRCEDHMSRIYPEGGYDHCANCGSRY